MLCRLVLNTSSTFLLSKTVYITSFWSWLHVAWHEALLFNKLR